MFYAVLAQETADFSARGKINLTNPDKKGKQTYVSGF
jgi:hypothetical protein